MSKKHITAKKDVFCKDRNGSVKIHTKDRSYKTLSNSVDDRGSRVVIPTDASGRHILLVDSDYFEQNFMRQ
jgi:histidinol phosphatase-like PHP family hydrolase